MKASYLIIRAGRRRRRRYRKEDERGMRSANGRDSRGTACDLTNLGIDCDDKDIGGPDVQEQIAPITFLIDYYVEQMMLLDSDSMTFNKFNRIPLPPNNRTQFQKKHAIWDALVANDRFMLSTEKITGGGLKQKTTLDKTNYDGAIFTRIRTTRGADVLFGDCQLIAEVVLPEQYAVDTFAAYVRGNVARRNNVETLRYTLDLITNSMKTRNNKECKLERKALVKRIACLTSTENTTDAILAGKETTASSFINVPDNQASNDGRAAKRIRCKSPARDVAASSNGLTAGTLRPPLSGTLHRIGERRVPEHVESSQPFPKSKGSIKGKGSQTWQREGPSVIRRATSRSIYARATHTPTDLHDPSPNYVGRYSTVKSSRERTRHANRYDQEVHQQTMVAFKEDGYGRRYANVSSTVPNACWRAHKI